MAGQLTRSQQHQHFQRSKERAAYLSVIYNSTFIVLKVIAGLLTGSVSIMTEALHSSIDLVAAGIATYSIKKSGEPADDRHLYGHEKIENLAAAVEGVLILLGSVVVMYEASRRLLNGSEIDSLNIGIAVIAASAVSSFAVARYLRRVAVKTSSAALGGDAAHLQSDSLTSVAVLIGLVLVYITGAKWIDSLVAMGVAVVIFIAGIKVLIGSSRELIDEALPQQQLQLITEAIKRFDGQGVVGFHKLRARSAGMRKHIDLHLQFKAGTSLEQAHATAHLLQDEIREDIEGAEVLIHIEPESSIRSTDN